MTDALIVGLLLIIAAQTSYLIYKNRDRVAAKAGDTLVDTSVLIDGRILAIARSGLMTSRLIVPRSVVRELQFMADKADHDKRERARFGLDTIEKLQQIPMISLEIIDDGDTNQHGVDEQLIDLARRTGARLCTIDYNLNKAARVQAIEVININELAHALRIVVLPGEKISVQLVQPGQDKKQAVGYLDDGTMVVVDDARELIGSEITVEITRALQTAAGRMMFAKRVGAQVDKTKRPAKVSSSSKSVQAPKTQSRERSVRNTADKSSSPSRQAGRRSRKTPEDALVSLANK